MRIEDSPAICPICKKLRANDKEVEKCIETHKNKSQEEIK